MLRGAPVERKYPVPLTLHQLWMVSLCAPVSREARASRLTLYPYKHVNGGRARKWLAEKWEISSRPALLGRLNKLARFGYRERAGQRSDASPLAWDIALYVDVVRNGFAAGYLEEADAWRLLHEIVPRARGAYGSWAQYAQGYLIGRLVWMDMLRGTPSEGFPAPQSVSDEHLRRLLDPANTESPWNLAPWEAIGHPDRTR
ncbi:DUF1266 domain-containing protein [Streptomyces sp. LZ34]